MSIFVRPPYIKELKVFNLIDFHNDIQLFVKRPPYQRKNIWPRHKKEALIDSFFRRHYVPDIVLRQIKTPDNRMKYEVVDGQQRINAIQEFFNNQFKLPKSLFDITDEVGKFHRDLSAEVKKHIEIQALPSTVLMALTDPHKKDSQKLVAEVFWRLQQGESLTYIEVEHSKLYSAARNFITKYADDLSFDYKKYESLDHNPSRHDFFKIINQDNARLQHLALLGRFMMLEFGNGSADLSTTYFSNFIQHWEGKSLIIFENLKETKNCLKTLDVLYNIFKVDHPVPDKVPELDREYIILSIYLLARRLVHGGWNFKPDHYDRFRNFVYQFKMRWQTEDNDDAEMLLFRDQRQQNKRAVEIRDQLLSKWFFEANTDLDKLDPQRNFTYSERVAIYRKDRGLCQACLAEGRNEDEARVPWIEFDADHLKPHSKGGKTTVDNGQVLCQHHNRSLGNKTRNGDKDHSPTPSDINYWLTPVKGTNAEEVVKTLVSEEGIWAYGDRTPGRNELKPGDWLCFYATGKGAIGHAKVMSRPEKKPHPKVIDSEKYPWTFRVGEAELYLDNPKEIDLEMRKELDAFRGKPLQKNWGWFLYGARKVSEKDFKLLTRE